MLTAKKVSYRNRNNQKAKRQQNISTNTQTVKNRLWLVPVIIMSLNAMKLAFLLKKLEDTTLKCST